MEDHFYFIGNERWPQFFRKWKTPYNLQEMEDDLNFDVDPVTRMESFRALKLSRLERFRVLRSYYPDGEFSHPKTLKIGEF